MFIYFRTTGYDKWHSDCISSSKNMKMSYSLGANFKGYICRKNSYVSFNVNSILELNL